MLLTDDYRVIVKETIGEDYVSIIASGIERFANIKGNLTKADVVELSTKAKEFYDANYDNVFAPGGTYPIGARREIICEYLSGKNVEKYICEKMEQNTFYDEDYDQQPPPDIIAYNELRSCADLVRMYDKGILDIQPDFQRDVVWRDAAQTRFVDSLIKQLPIPSMCFSLDHKTQRWQVIDGLQRMSSIIRFLTQKSWRLSYLKDIDGKISGRKVSEFFDETSDLNILLQRVENLTLPITVIRCDYTKKNHTDYLFTIFHRLNTGAIKLNNQEIRNCIYNGNFNSLLKRLDKNDHWRRINRLEDDETYRFTYMEQILRFFAFHDKREKYTGNLAKFLNDFMSDKMKLSEQELNDKEKLFNRTVEVINEKIIGAQESRLLVSVLESLLYGVSKNIDYVETLSKENAMAKFTTLKQHESLSSTYLRGGIADKEKVNARLLAGLNTFKEN